jgi:RimJ/RimL family protein N-acetyltransferase
MPENTSKENIRLINISKDNIEILYEFLSRCNTSLKSFRYFDSRIPLHAIKNHSKTIILSYKELPIGYGHLDVEDEKTWLGICLADDFTGMGLGNIIMEALLDKVDFSVCLSVDIDNHNAIKLYKKFGFVDVEVNKETIFMERS